MSPLTEAFVFAGVMALGQASPGPDLLLVTRTALAQGARAGTQLSLGIACGLAIHTAVAMAGVAVLLTGASPLARGLRMAAACYLAWLALGLLRGAWSGGSGTADFRPGNGSANGWVLWRRGFLCNVLNPKVALFLAAVGASFTRAEHPAWWPWLLAAIIVAEGLLLWVAWTHALQWPPLKSRYLRAARWLDAGFGVVLLSLAVRMLAL